MQTPNKDSNPNQNVNKPSQQQKLAPGSDQQKQQAQQAEKRQEKK